MAIRKSVYKIQNIVPVRFTRSSNPTGGTNAQNAPDLDDRGYVRYDGPVVGCIQNETVQIGVVREMLDNNAPLYATSEDTAKLVIDPATAQLANGHQVDVKFTPQNVTGDVKLQIRAQAADGPIVAVLTVHISTMITVRCAVHRTAIYNAGGSRAAANTTTRSFADITRLMDTVNEIWKPCGISFRVTSQKDDTNLTNQVARNSMNPQPGILLCPVYGSGESNENFDRIMATNVQANRLNIYFVRSIQAATTVNPPNYAGFGSAAHRGLVVADSTRDIYFQAHVVAHELGHILNLSGRRSGAAQAQAYAAHSDDDPGWDASVYNRRHDLWTRRRLMYYMVGLQADERTNVASGRYGFDGRDVGYGVGTTGRLLTIKNLVNDATDNEYTDARNAASALPANFRA